MKNKFKLHHKNLTDQYRYLAHDREKWVMMLHALWPHVTLPPDSSRSYKTPADTPLILLNDKENMDDRVYKLVC